MIRLPRLGLLLLLLTGCQQATVELSTTSSLIAGPTATVGATSTTVEGGESPSTTLRGQFVADYEVTARVSTENGEVLHIVIPSGGYTDIDLENFIIGLKESDPALWGAEVFDDPAGPETFAVPDDQKTTEDVEFLDRHHLISLVGGDTIVFRGPFSDLGETVIGS